jgi:hypothetical protein
VLDPRRIVQTRTGKGGAAPGVVAAMARECADDAARMRDEARAARDGFDTAENALMERARQLAREG